MILHFISNLLCYTCDILCLIVLFQHLFHRWEYYAITINALFVAYVIGTVVWNILSPMGLLFVVYSFISMLCLVVGCQNWDNVLAIKKQVKAIRPYCEENQLFEVAILVDKARNAIVFDRPDLIKEQEDSLLLLDFTPEEINRLFYDRKAA